GRRTGPRARRNRTANRIARVAMDAPRLQGRNGPASVLPAAPAIVPRRAAAIARAVRLAAEEGTTDETPLRADGAESRSREILPAGEGRLGSGPEDRDQHHQAGAQAAGLSGAQPTRPGARAGTRWR